MRFFHWLKCRQNKQKNKCAHIMSTYVREKIPMYKIKLFTEIMKLMVQLLACKSRMETKILPSNRLFNLTRGSAEQICSLLLTSLKNKLHLEHGRCWMRNYRFREGFKCIFTCNFSDRPFFSTFCKKCIFPLWKG